MIPHLNKIKSLKFSRRDDIAFTHFDSIYEVHASAVFRRKDDFPRLKMCNVLVIADSILNVIYKVKYRCPISGWWKYGILYVYSRFLCRNIAAEKCEHLENA